MAWIKSIDNYDHYKLFISEVDRLVDLPKRTSFEDYLLEVYTELLAEYEDKMEEDWFNESS